MEACVLVNTLLHICVGSTGFGDRILQLLSVASLGAVLNSSVSTYWRTPDTLTRWDSERVIHWKEKHGIDLNVSDTCDLFGARSSLELEQVLQMMQLPQIISFHPLEKIQDIYDNTLTDKHANVSVIRTLQYYDLFPGTSYLQFFHHLRSAGISFSEYLAAWDSMGEGAFELKNEYLNGLSMTIPEDAVLSKTEQQETVKQGLKLVDINYIAIHLRRGDKSYSIKRGNKIVGEISRVSESTVTAVKSVLEQLGNGQVYIVVSDDEREKSDAESYIRKNGGVVPVLNLHDSLQNRVMVDFVILSCAAGIIQSVANDGHSSFSYLASFIRYKSPILNVHPQPKETLLWKTIQRVKESGINDENAAANEMSLGDHVYFYHLQHGFAEFIRHLHVN